MLAFVEYNTGLWFSAIVSSKYSGSGLALAKALWLTMLFVHPHTWLETLAYSAILSQNVYLSYALVVRREKVAVLKELKLLALTCLLYFALLLVSAFVESISIMLGV